MDDRQNLQRLDVHVELAGCDPGGIQQLIDELDLHGDVAFDHRERFLRGGFSGSAAAQHLEPSLDDVERRPQFVGQRRQKPVFCSSRLLRHRARES